MTEQSPNQVWYDDLLVLKMHQKPAGGGMGHFWLAVVHIGRREVIYVKDGLKNDGVCRLCVCQV
jgi:hypothetical protein